MDWIHLILLHQDLIDLVAKISQSDFDFHRHHHLLQGINELNHQYLIQTFTMFLFIFQDLIDSILNTLNM